MLRSMFILCLIVAVGCAKPTAEIMDSWKGSHVSRLIRSWGPPQQITSDGLDGKIYIYSNTSHTSVTAPFRIVPGSKPILITKSGSNSRTRMFWADKDGFIYYWKAEGDIKKRSDLSSGGIMVMYAILFVIAIIGAAGGFESLD